MAYGCRCSAHGGRVANFRGSEWQACLVSATGWPGPAPAGPNVAPHHRQPQSHRSQQQHQPLKPCRCRSPPRSLERFGPPVAHFPPTITADDLRHPASGAARPGHSLTHPSCLFSTFSQAAPPSLAPPPPRKFRDGAPRPTGVAGMGDCGQWGARPRGLPRGRCGLNWTVRVDWVVRVSWAVRVRRRRVGRRTR
jgi:hypothetical protein